MSTIHVAILVYPGVEMIDMNGPLDVLLKANGFNNSRYNIYTVAEDSAAVPSENALVTISPSYTLSNCPDPNIIVLPGQIISEGPSMSFGHGSEKLLAWINEQAKKPNVMVMSVCIGAYILANTGLLTNKRATTHYLSIQDIQAAYPATKFIKNVRYISDGNIVTTGGITSGIDGALYLVELNDGSEIAQHVADIMVYNREAPLPPYTLLPPYE